MAEFFTSLAFPWQISIAVGYLAFVLAYGVERKKMGQLDTLFIALIFSTICYLIFLGVAVLQSLCGGGWLLVPVLFSSVSTLLLGAWWFRSLRSYVLGWMKQKKLEEDDNLLSAWETILRKNRDAYVNEIYIDLLDGTTLLCENVRAYNDACPGAVLGNDGSIAIYVEAFRKPGSDWENANEVRNNEGDLLTYIPANQIKSIDLRAQARQPL